MSGQLTAILHHAPLALLVIFRLAGLMIFAPMLGSTMLPARVKIFLSIVLGLAVYPTVLTQMADHAPLALDLWSLTPLLFAEVLIGAAIGFMAGLPLISVSVGGLMMGQQMGLGFARLFNPAAGVDQNVIGQILFMVAMVGFVMIGGIESMVLAVLHSFEHIPPPALGGIGDQLEMLSVIVGLLAAAFEMAMRVAAPLLALIFLQTLAMGFIAKSLPQVNILSLGFPIRILAGLAIIALGLVVLDEVVMDLVTDSLDVILSWVDTL